MRGFASGDDGHGGQAGVGDDFEVVVGVQVVAGGAPGVAHELGGGACSHVTGDAVLGLGLQSRRRAELFLRAGIFGRIQF